MAEQRDVQLRKAEADGDRAPAVPREDHTVRPAPAMPLAPEPTLSAPAEQVPLLVAPPPVPGQVASQGQHTNVNVTTNVGGPTMVFTHQKTGPGFFVRALWYVFIGWWASALAIVAAYVAMFTVIGIPLAFFIINRLPTLLTLRPRTQDWSVRVKDGVTHVGISTLEQRPWWQRAIYFVCIGWWFGAIWLTLAWTIGVVVVTLPLSFWMYNRISGVMTLQRH